MKRAKIKLVIALLREFGITEKDVSDEKISLLIADRRDKVFFSYAPESMIAGYIYCILSE